MNTFTITIVSPYKTVFSGECAMLSATSLSGSFGILANHAPILAALAPSVIDITRPDGARQEIPVSSGLLEFSQNTCAVAVQE